MVTEAPSPFEDLNAVLRELVTSVQAALGDNFAAAYLQGSFAVGDFDEDSDVDFLVVTAAEVSETELSNLQAMHARIYDLDCSWAQHLEGSYFTKEMLRCSDTVGEPIWYLDNCSKVLVRSKHDNTWVVRWVVWEHGITLAGPSPRTQIDPVSVDDLRREVWATMRTWAEEIFADPGQMNNRWYQSFAVISYCRMLHTLQTGVVRSKLAGAQWGTTTLDPEWSGLILRAWNERPNPSLKVRQPADPDDFKSTLAFIEYALHIGRHVLQV